MYERAKLYVGGEWVEPAEKGRFDVVNPATEEVIGFAPRATPSDVDRAVAAARDAFDNGSWPRTSPTERADALGRMADYLAAHARPLAELGIDEAGVPITFSYARELGASVVFRFFEKLTREFTWREVRHGAAAPALVVREPAGVVAAIVPFNGPLLSSSAKIAPAIASGCCIVFKPAPETPLDAFVVAEAAEAAGIPPGVVNVLPGDASFGAALVGHPGIDRVVFTGSTAGGRAVATACSPSMKRMTLELGGKAAAMFLDDAPVEASLAATLPMSMFNSGQACIALSRILVPRGRMDEFVDAAVAAVDKMTLGDPRDPATVLGPVIARHHRDRIEAMIDRATAEGCQVARGGARPTRLDRGWYVEPTIFRDVDPQAYIAQNEVFGPVLAIIPHDGDDDAVRVANATPFGLSGAVFTTDMDRALAIASRVRVGTFGINGYALDFGLPFGGVKQSGVGREFGVEGLAEYTEVKAVALPAGTQVSV